MHLIFIDIQINLKKQPTTSELGNEQAKEVATVFDEMVSEALADILANAIDYYVKNMNITGTIITVGGPTTQTATIAPAPTPITGGKIPKRGTGFFGCNFSKLG